MYEDDKTAGTCPDTSLALLQAELAKAEEESEVWSYVWHVNLIISYRMSAYHKTVSLSPFCVGVLRDWSSREMTGTITLNILYGIDPVYGELAILVF